MKFTDGMTFDTSGQPRAEYRRDGWYVVGDGALIPTKDRTEAEEVVRSMRARRDRRP